MKIKDIASEINNGPLEFERIKTARIFLRHSCNQAEFNIHRVDFCVSSLRACSLVTKREMDLFSPNKSQLSSYRAIKTG